MRTVLNLVLIFGHNPMVYPSYQYANSTNLGLIFGHNPMVYPTNMRTVLVFGLIYLLQNITHIVVYTCIHMQCNVLTRTLCNGCGFNEKNPSKSLSYKHHRTDRTNRSVWSVSWHVRF